MDFFGAYWQIYRSAPIVFSLGLTGKVCLYALVLHILIGIPLAWYLSGRSSPWRSALESLITFPLIFPPIAIGYLLLVVLGRFSLLGDFFSHYLSVEIVFTQVGVVFAAFIAGLPLIVKPVRAAIQELGRDLIEASYILGRGRLVTFVLVTLPLIRRSILQALILGIGRSLGEVGITLMLGGNIIGKTNTLSLEVFNAVNDGDFERASALCLLLFLFSLLMFATLRLFGSRTS